MATPANTRTSRLRLRSLGLARGGRVWPPFLVELRIGRQERRYGFAPHQARKLILDFAFMNGWFPAGATEPITPQRSPPPLPSLPPVSESRNQIRCGTRPCQTNRPNLSPTSRVVALESTSLDSKVEKLLSRFSRKARPSVDVNKCRIAGKGPELQVTEPSPSLRTSGARACTQTHRTLAHQRAHQHAQSVWGASRSHEFPPPPGTSSPAH